MLTRIHYLTDAYTYSTGLQKSSGEPTSYVNFTSNQSFLR